MAKILIIDDHPVIQRLVHELLEKTHDAAFTTAEPHSVLETRHTERGVVLMDLDMPNYDGLEATERLRSYAPDAHIVILTAPKQEQVVSISSAQHSPTAPNTISYRISRRAARHAAPMTHSRSETETNAHQNTPETTIRPLTGREQEILHLIRCGRKNREIAATLCIAESTVHKHIQNIFEKLHARNRTEAIYLTSTVS